MIKYHDESKEIHLTNNHISYIIKIFDNGRVGHLYFGKKIKRYHNFSHLLQTGDRAMAIYQKEREIDPSLQYTKMEYPVYGTGDFRGPAIEIEQENGSRITEFVYDGHKIYRGKKGLKGLPALYVEDENEAETLELYFKRQCLWYFAYT